MDEYKFDDFFIQYHDPAALEPTRDPRWEHVRASVGHYEYDIDSDSWSPSEHLVAFEIEIVDGEWLCWQRTLCYKADLEDYPELYKMMLDECVEKLDDYLERRANGTLEDDS